MPQFSENLDPKEYILIKGARIHNLKNLDVAIPRNQLVVVTGLSGSGKSSLAFDTLYAEGQRRYVESLNAYARQFLGRINKPEVDYIKGISPAIAIEQKVITRNPRSTVGTSTELYDYMKLLFARIGKTYSPVSGKEVKRDTVSDVVDLVQGLPDGTRIFILAPIERDKKNKWSVRLQVYLQQGYQRIRAADAVYKMEELLNDPLAMSAIEKASSIGLVIDRMMLDQPDEEWFNRLSDSCETAYFEGHGILDLMVSDASGKTEVFRFNKKFERDGVVFEEPSVHLFSFNNPLGACRRCDGFGTAIGIDPDLVIPDKSLSLYDGAVACWKGETMSAWKDDFIRKSNALGFPVHRPYSELTEAEKEVLWNGNKSKKLDGINQFFEFLESQVYKIQYRVMLSRYRGKTICSECRGSRLRKEALYVKVHGMNIGTLCAMPVKQLNQFFETLLPEEREQEIAARILKEIRSRLGFLMDVGLGYLSLNRPSATLSGGESQRINLATSLGSSLVGSMYILDEPSIGLHPRDTHRLIGILKALRNLKNSVIVVEHDEEIMKAANTIIDIGPQSGRQGGRLMFQGNWDALRSEKESLTARYLNGIECIEVPAFRRPWKECIELKGARENNLRNLNVRFPLRVMTAVTGVSGSGKTSLIKRVLYPALMKHLDGYAETSPSYDSLDGAAGKVEAVELVDQNPIGKSSRSNPVTYMKAWDEIRSLFCEQPLAKARGYKPSLFSFNVEGGRCEMCQGEGEVKIEMQFMADIQLTCEVCEGKRFKQEILEVDYRGKNAYDLLCLTVQEAIEFFSEQNGTAEARILQKIQPLSEVGLGYIQLGQASSTLSGGEAQRIKLASFLLRGAAERKTLFIFDEPTTGLHFHDIRKLLHAFNALLDRGHTVLVIEHNTDVIKCADWVIDLGPEGGDEGGQIVFEGTPEDLCKLESSHTGHYLKAKLT